jgi:arabinofuranosyltransferase
VTAVATRPAAPEARLSTAPVTNRRWADRAPFVASALFSAVFIGRSAFRIRGRLAFSLFDDAMVSMTYARNLAHGHGLVWTPGAKPVEGFTNPLWTLWMAALHLWGLPDRLVPLAVMVSGAVLLLLTLVAVRRLARDLAGDDRLVVGVASWATVACYPLVYWTLRGMEVGLLACLATTAAMLAVEARRTGRPRLPAIAVVLALGVLTREDFAVVAAVVVVVATAAWSLERRRVAVTLGTVVAGTLAAQEAFRLAYFHELLPNTYVLKIVGTPLLQRLDRGALVLLQTVGLELVVPLAVIALGMALRRGRQDPAELFLLGIVTGLCAYTLWTGGDAWEWMLTPDRFVTIGLPLVAVLTGIAVRRIRDADDPARLHRLALRVVTGGAALVVAAVCVDGGPTGLMLGGGTSRFRETAIVAFVSLVVIVSVTAARAVLRPGRLALALALAAIVGIAGVAMQGWARTTGDHVHDDQREARLGDELRRVTDARATIAVTWAGAVPYFSHRHTIDLLGKADPVVARSRPHPGGFYPGHTKWDYGYSIGRLRPDVVTFVLRGADRATLARIRSWGYVQIAPRSFVRAGTRDVDVTALRDFVRRHPPIG